MTTSHCKRVMNEDTHGLFRFFNTKNAQKYQNFYLATEVEHDQSSYFCRGLDDFYWAPAPVGPTLVNGPSRKRCKIGGKLVLIINRKSYMSFRFVPKSIILNDLER